MPVAKTNLATLVLGCTMLALVVALLVWAERFGQNPRQVDDRATTSAPAPALRLGVVPERDIYAQRRRYQTLVAHLEKQLGEPVELVTLSTYQGVLDDLAERKIDGAFVGSLVAVLAVDRLGAQLIAKPQQPDGGSTYRGVLFVRDDSPVRSVRDLSGRTIAMLRATTAGDLFPIYLLHREGMLDGPEAPTMRWMGTHDQVIEQVIDGYAEAGAVKDLRLASFESAHAPTPLRRLAESEPVPNNSLVLCGDLPSERVAQVRRLLLDMHTTEEGRATLASFEAARFLACELDEFHAIYRMVQALGPAWEWLRVDGPAPTMPTMTADE